LREGKGILKTIFGDVYEGYFKNDLINGFGTLKKANGEFFESEFLDGQINGKTV
jgi:hypothetical protein